MANPNGALHAIDAPIDWLDVVAMRVEGATSSWVNAIVQDVVAGHRPVLHTWTQPKEAMV